MVNKNRQDSPELISYYQLRRAIGFIGLALPFALMIGEMIVKRLFPDARGPQNSMSEYYYTAMRGVFVGSLCAIGVFLGAYRGYDERKDRIAGWIACICAVGVALVPVSPDQNYPDWRQYLGWAHYTFAATLFATLGYYCLALFTMHKPTDEPEPKKKPTPEKKQRNLVYVVCGWTIYSCIGVIAVFEVLFLNPWSPFLSPTMIGWAPVYWLEAVAVVAFGVSWLIKGELVLADGENMPT
jgi:hypothetical protein